MQRKPPHDASLIGRILLTLPVCVALTLAAAQLAYAQDQPSERTQEATKPQVEQPPAEVQELANRVATNISKLTAKRKVLVLDFRGPEKLWLPFSAWLADQFSVALERVDDGLEITPRSELAAAIAERHLPAKDMFDDKTAEGLAKSLGADAIVIGSFVAFGDGLSIGITYLTTAGNSWASAPPTQNVHGKIQLNPEIAAHLGAPLDSFRPKDGVYGAGEAGFGYPSCVRCPRASYPPAASTRRIQGRVVLEATITADGRAIHVKVKESLDSSLDEAAMDAVRTWKLKPATDPDGKAIPVRQTIEVTFHLY
jgi:TonB family protein